MKKQTVFTWIAIFVAVLMLVACDLLFNGPDPDPDPDPDPIAGTEQLQLRMVLPATVTSYTMILLIY